MTMTLPGRATAENYKLIPSGRFYKTRYDKVRGIVLHITAGLQDLGMKGDDPSAEGTNAWQLRAKPEASWNAISDSDSCILCLPDWYTAWHCFGYNSKTVGLEISKLDTDWTDVPDEWIDATLRNAAKWCAAIVKKHNLPLTLSTKAEVDRAIARGEKFGFTYHGWLNPETRTDPGLYRGKDTFPIELLFRLIRIELGEEDDMTPEEVAKEVRKVLREEREGIAKEVWGYPLDYPKQMLPEGSDPKSTSAERWLVHSNRKAGNAWKFAEKVWNGLRKHFGWDDSMGDDLQDQQ